MSKSEPQYIVRSTETIHDIAGDVVRMLKQLGQTLAVAESLTGGCIMAAITSVSGSSAVFTGGVVSYATPLKQKLLGVDADLIAQHGVIHSEIALQMAEGARETTTFDVPTTWGLSTTGVAGPTSQDNKPVGMVFIGLAEAKMSQGLGPFLFPGNREQIREATVVEALSLLRKELAIKLAAPVDVKA